MNKPKMLPLAVLTMLATGCATVSMQDQAADEVRTYCAQRLADARIDPLREKILLPLSIGEPQPIEMLANRTFATSDEELAKAVERITRVLGAKSA